MTFQSILSEQHADEEPGDALAAPAVLADLRLDQIIDTITAGKQDYDLRPLFCAIVHDLDTIAYRHEVFHDLEQRTLYEHVTSFAHGMGMMRRHLAQAGTLSNTSQKQRWLVEAVKTYCEAVAVLARDLAADECLSRGFLALREYLAGYVRSEGFGSLRSEAEELIAELSAVSYCLRITGNRIDVRKYASEPDLSADVEATFAKFEQGGVQAHRFSVSDPAAMNHVEAQILECVARLYPDPFLRLHAFCSRHADYIDDVIRRFDREVQFYLAYLDYTELFKRAGLSFCYPQVSTTCKETHVDDVFDLALADKLIAERAPVICNDFHLSGDERIFVVTGPNQGGKTTFARTVGQVHFLTGLGCFVPGCNARIFLCDRLFSHFEREEDIKDLRSKLEDDLVRMRDILDRATSSSLIILNEALTSTTLSDAIFLSKEMMQRIVALDALCIWVTFVDELASFGASMVSMVSTVRSDKPSVRTYKVVRRQSDGLAYALSIAEKYHLTFERIQERIRP